MSRSRLQFVSIKQLCPSSNFRHVAFGHCFRKEAGGAGLATRGLYRVHQFSKVELFALSACENGEESEQLLQDMVDLQVEIMEDLGLCYR